MRSKTYGCCVVGLGLWAFSVPVQAQPRYRPVAVETRFKGVDPARVDRVEPALRERAAEMLEVMGPAFRPLG